jgi:7-dehydrocholesterol reductase
VIVNAVPLGSILYNMLMGVELNPRFGKHWDWKLFINGRPGIIGWLLMSVHHNTGIGTGTYSVISNLSFTALQHQRFGHVTNSIVIINLIQGVYILDFFANESWYVCHSEFPAVHPMKFTIPTLTSYTLTKPGTSAQ